MRNSRSNLDNFAQLPQQIRCNGGRDLMIRIPGSGDRKIKSKTSRT